MKFRVVVLLPVVWALVVSTDPPTSTNSTSTAKPVTLTPTKSVSNSSVAHKTNDTRMLPGHNNKGFDMDSSMIQRALYVLTGITIIGILVKVVRRKKPGVTHRKKYGLLSNQDNMEMASLESDEDDTTLYEARTLRR